MDPAAPTETPRVGTIAPLPPDRERDAGFRGDAWVKASVMFGLVFLAGFAIVAMILVSRRRK